ncbi:MAG TPA: hypothetical protein VLB44_27580 [Kofleriaceae bacterium]|nr:hypothetical protein [Kofleriaceae bacterium]
MVQWSSNETGVDARTDRSETRELIELCGGYFGAYVLTGILVKYFTAIRSPKLSQMAYLFDNSVGGSLFALIIVVFAGWVHLRSNRHVKIGPFTVPSEVKYIIPSGVCTAVIIPTTTLMYSLPMSVMVAMVIMRGSIIVISRAVDGVQIRQGVLKKRVYAEENWAVVFALLAVATNILLLPIADKLGIAHSNAKGSFEFIHSPFALGIMGSYIVAYAIRIYVMNYFKNTRGQGVPLDNKGFFAVEQIAATVSMIVIVAVVLAIDGNDPRILDLQHAVHHPDALAVLSGIPYGAVAFFSVFIFMFKGRTATFAGLVNRLTSLVAGIAATLLLALLFGTAWPSIQDWVSVGFIAVAVWFLSQAERRRIADRT